MDYAYMHTKMIEFIKDNTKGFDGAVLGLSGGLDSAVVARLLSDAQVPTIALLMPTNSSSKTNLNDALSLCDILDMPYEIQYIDTILRAFKDTCGASDLREYNLCARIRMSLLYDLSARTNRLVVGTTNKSERMLGYGTIHGDLACAFNPIGDVYKSDLFGFASYLGLPRCFIDKAPSADFYEGQSDEGELGYSYAKLDECLKNQSNDKTLNKFVENKIKKNLFKQTMPKILYFNPND